MTTDLIESIDNGVATLTLNRPDRLNALSADMLQAMNAALRRLAADPAVGAIVVTGAGRGFCAGGDVKRMAATGSVSSEPDAVTTLREKMEVARLLHEIPKPTIAMINGPAAGAGLSLALACDLRIAAASARLNTSFAKVGLPGDFGGSFFLPALIGQARARELYFMADTLSADQALALGIVGRVVPDAELLAVTTELARRLAHGPTLAFGMMKRNFSLAEKGDLPALLDLEATQQIAAGTTADHREAAQAFVEKRPPVFSGR